MSRNINYTNNSTISTNAESDIYFGNGNIQEFISDGNFTVPAGITRLRVSVLGAGAAGNNFHYSYGGSSTSGGTSSFGSLLTATGGNFNGIGGTVSGGPGFNGGTGGGAETRNLTSNTGEQFAGGGGGAGGGGKGGTSSSSGCAGTDGPGDGTIGGNGGRGISKAKGWTETSNAISTLSTSGGLGAGGGGGCITYSTAEQTTSNGGGGGGFIKRILNVTPGQVIPVTVGIGGQAPNMFNISDKAGAGGNGKVVVEY